ncbi:MerR family DNA-binding transcriptional regulator [Streptomyces chartreusis]|uniref:MerR family DNA-binding transcriptional regulator n=1 Tax=Streptomyces chartreusis TaxID=1969 RepID=UPI0035E192EA
MKIGELSSRTGVSVRLLRYYEEQGLLLSQRTAGGHRSYDLCTGRRARHPDAAGGGPAHPDDP